MLKVKYEAVVEMKSVQIVHQLASDAVRQQENINMHNNNNNNVSCNDIWTEKFVTSMNEQVMANLVNCLTINVSWVGYRAAKRNWSIFFEFKFEFSLFQQVRVLKFIFSSLSSAKITSVSSSSSGWQK